MDSRGTGTLLIAAGALPVVADLLIRGGLLLLFGHLPGDFRYEGEHTRVYLPFASGLLVPVILSAVATVARRFF